MNNSYRLAEEPFYRAHCTRAAVLNAFGHPEEALELLMQIKFFKENDMDT